MEGKKGGVRCRKSIVWEVARRVLLCENNCKGESGTPVVYLLVDDEVQLEDVYSNGVVRFKFSME